MPAAQQQEHTVTVNVDGEPVDTPRDTTPNAIISGAHVDPATHYLVRIEGRSQHSYAGKGDEHITVHQSEKFVTVSTGPTPTA